MNNYCFYEDYIYIHCKVADFRYRHRLLLVPKHMHVQFTIYDPAMKHPGKIGKKKTWIL